MKKRIVGVALTALLLGSSIGYAANSSLIGARVTGIFTVQQDGKKVAEAVVINGSAYAPVRAISDATSTALKVEGKTIIMESKPVVTGETEQIKTETPVISDKVLTEEEKSILRERLASSDAVIKRLRELIAQTKNEIESPKEYSKVDETQKFLSDLEARLAAYEVINADIKSQLGQ